MELAPPKYDNGCYPWFRQNNIGQSKIAMASNKCSYRTAPLNKETMYIQAPDAGAKEQKEDPFTSFLLSSQRPLLGREQMDLQFSPSRIWPMFKQSQSRELWKGNPHDQCGLNMLLLTSWAHQAWNTSYSVVWGICYLAKIHENPAAYIKALTYIYSGQYVHTETHKTFGWGVGWEVVQQLVTNRNRNILCKGIDYIQYNIEQIEKGRNSFFLIQTKFSIYSLCFCVHSLKHSGQFPGNQQHYEANGQKNKIKFKIKVKSWQIYCFRYLSGP